jgi:hypothetical protein
MKARKMLICSAT